MNAREHITMLLKEWLELTHLESHAIRVGRWSEMTRVERAKTELAQPLTNAVKRWKSENPDESRGSPFHREIDRLIALENQNSRLIAVRKLEVREKILIIEQALYDLRYVQGAFEPRCQAA